MDAPTDPQLVGLNDYASRRKLIFDYAMDGIKSKFPVENTQVRLRVDNLAIEDGDKDFTPREQKEALLSGNSLTRKIKGNWILEDLKTGEVLGKTSKKTIVNIPWLTDRGTFIRNGSESSIVNQFRLIPGVFVKNTEDGRVETHVNVKPGTGHMFKVSMDPANPVFEVLVKGRKIKLYPLLKALGIQDESMEQAWGKEILDKNRKGDTERTTTSAFQTFGSFRKIHKTAAEAPPEEVAPNIEDVAAAFQRMELDPLSVASTLGKPYANVSPELLLDTTKKMIMLNRGLAMADDRDSLEFQRVHMAHDFIKERIAKDSGGMIAKMLWKATARRSLDHIPAGALNKHVDALFNSGGLTQYVEEINPLDPYDQAQRVTRLGEGALGDAVPDEARAVQPTFRGYVDPIRGPQSSAVGLDMRMAHGVKVGRDGLLYREMLNAKTGKPEWVSSTKAANSVIGFPEALTSKDDFVPATVNAEGLQYVHKDKIDYVLKSPGDLFSTVSNMVPLLAGTKGGRLLMGAAYHLNALPLLNREAPFVRGMLPDGTDAHQATSKFVGVVRAEQPGVVESVGKDSIRVKNQDGTSRDYQMYHNFPFARKSSLSNIAAVEKGQVVKEGDLIATSNFSNKKGETALGLNLRVAYMPFKGYLHEDAVVISESVARKLTSEMMTSMKMREDVGVEPGLTSHMSSFPAAFNEEQRKTIGADGLVKIGTVVKNGDPLILAVKRQAPTIGSMGRRMTTDHSVVWDHHDTGVVTDSRKTKDGWRVQVRANSAAQPGDKLCGRHGNKGVVSLILPDDQMPKDSRGRPLEILFNPYGVSGRTNSAQMIEAALGKVVDKTGKPYILKPFSENSDDSLVKFARAELERNGLKDKEDVFDPGSGRVIPEVFVGNVHVHKLQHTAEAKAGGRSFGGYSQDKLPSTGGHSGGKRLGSMEISSMFSHGALENLKEMKLVKGQENYDYWRDVKLGRTPLMPRSSFLYDKFRSQMRAAGIHLEDRGEKTHIFAMTNKQADELTQGREIQTTDTYDAKKFTPITGGLFDEKLTGGVEGNLFASIKLDEPVLNPIMEDSVRRILGVTIKEMDALAGGDTEYKGKLGGRAMKARLDDINLDTELLKARNMAKGSSGQTRDAAVKKIRAIMSMREHGVKPGDFMMDIIPVLPPSFRPITTMDGENKAADANYMYRELMFARDDMREAAEILPDRDLAEARKRLINSYKSLVGLEDSDNTELSDKKVGGILATVFGKTSPKVGQFQRRMIGVSQDLSTRAPIIPDPTLRIDQIGLPFNRAWELYEPFVVRRLVRGGMPAVQAAKAVADRTSQAEGALQECVKERPVMINRAPTMHKWSIVGMWPRLIKGDSMMVPNAVLPPLGGDYDGDVLTIHIPVSDAAVKETIDKMMPNKMLLAGRDFKLIYGPKMEYVHGAWLATKKPKEGKTVEFATVDDAKAAFRAGKIDIDTPIKINRLTGRS